MQKRSFDSLKEARDRRSLSPEDREIHDSIARIGKTSDGRILMEYLAKTVLFGTAGVGNDDGALRDLEAERRVAVRILFLLNGELSDNGNDTDRRDPRGRLLDSLGGIGKFLRRHAGSQ